MYDGVFMCVCVCVCIMIYSVDKSLAAGGAAESSRRIEVCVMVYSDVFVCVCVCMYVY